MSENNVYTETEVNKMLGDQKINLRLDNAENAINKISDKIVLYVEAEKEDAQKILKAIELSGIERRECEIKLRAEIQKIDSDHHDKFVKKTDLRIYAWLIIFAVTATTGFTAWISAQKFDDNAADKIAELILKKIGK